MISFHIDCMYEYLDAKIDVIVLLTQPPLYCIFRRCEFTVRN